MNAKFYRNRKQRKLTPLVLTYEISYVYVPIAAMVTLSDDDVTDAYYMDECNEKHAPVSPID